MYLLKTRAFTLAIHDIQYFISLFLLDIPFFANSYRNRLQQFIVPTKFKKIK